MHLKNTVTCRAALLVSTTLIAAPVWAATDAGVEISAAGAATEVKRLVRDDLAGTVFQASDGRVVDILLTDGTTLTLAPGSIATLSCYAASGCLNVTLTQGALRLTGRRPGAAPVRVTTPAGTAVLEDGAATFVLGADGMLTSALLFGSRLTVSADGDTETLRRPGYQLRATQAGGPTDPERRSGADIQTETALFNPVAGLLVIAPGAGDEESTEEEAEVALVQERVAVEVTDAVANQQSTPAVVNPPTQVTPNPTIFAPTTTTVTPTRIIVPPIVTSIPFPGFGSFSVAGANPFGANQSEVYSIGRGISGTAETEGDENGLVEVAAVFNTTIIGRTRTDDNRREYIGLSTTRFFNSDLVNSTSLSDLDSSEVEEPFVGVLADVSFFEDQGFFGETEDGIYLIDAKNTETFETFLPATGITIPSERFIFYGQIPNGFRILEDKRVIKENEFSLSTTIYVVGEGESNDRFIWLEGPSKFDFIYDAVALREDDLGILTDPVEGPVFTFAVGGVDADNLDAARREDVFLLTPGMTDLGVAGEFDDNGFWVIPPTTLQKLSNQRAFVRSAPDGTDVLALADTGLRIIGAPQASQVPGDTQEERDFQGLGAPGQVNGLQSAAVHADFGIDTQDIGQKSSISVTIGDVVYNVGSGYGPLSKFDGSWLTVGTPKETALTARTIGSHRGLGTNKVTDGSVAVTSDYFSTVAGGGNPNFVDSAGATIAGRAGYFVLDNYDPAPGDGRYATGGEERGTGQAPGKGQRYAQQRVAFGISSTERATAPDIDLTGFAAGLGEKAGAEAGKVAVEPFWSAGLTAAGASGFSIASDAATNRLEASLTLVNLPDPSKVTEFKLGGFDADVRGASAYLDENRFAARSPKNVGNTANPGSDGNDLALVSAGLLKEGAASANAETRELLDAMTESPDYKWGFFFGDAEVGGETVHTHLGTWIAGKETDPSLLDQWANEDASKIPGGGIATYSGSAIGNVVNGAQQYTARGTYTNEWNFKNRQGQTNLAFDGTGYEGTTTNPAGTAAVQGRLTSSSARQALINGRFVGGNAAALPLAQIGAFAASDGKGYVASGTFGANRP